MDDVVGEGRPADIPVAVGLPAPHGQGGVEQQYAARSPFCQCAVPGRLDAEVVMQFPENVLQARGRLYTGLHRKTEPVCLAGAMIGVLT